MKLNFFNIGEVNDEELKFAVISALYNGKWIFVKHKERDTWEIPGGHREPGENIDKTASRELFEETGARDFEIKPVCDYSVTCNNTTTYGRLYFSEVNEMGKLPNLEIGEVKLFNKLPSDLTYPQIQPYLYKKVISLRNSFCRLK